MKKKNIFLAIISMILLFQTPANAVTKFWIGGTSTDWSLGSNWSPAGVPLATDDVIIQDAAPASLQDCILTANVSCASLSAGINNANKFIIGNFTLTVTGNIVGGTSFGEYLLAMSPGSVIVASGNITDGGFLFDLTLGTGILRLEGATTSNISTLGDFNPITVNKTTGSTVTIDAGQLGSVPSVTMQNGTFAPSNLPVQQFFQQAFLKKLIVSGTNSTINVSGVGVMHVIDVEVLSGTCTIDNSDQLHVYDDWTQTGGTVLQSDPTKFISFRNMQAVILAPTQIVLALDNNPLNEINNAVISGSAVNIQANARIFKEVASTTGAVPMPITENVTIISATVIGTPINNKKLEIRSGQLVLQMGVSIPIRVNGNIDIINIGVLNASTATPLLVELTGNFSTNLSTLLTPPFITQIGSNGSTVTFRGATNSIINVNALTCFNNLTVSKDGSSLGILDANVRVTPDPLSEIICIQNDFSIQGGTFVARNLTDLKTTVAAISAINNPFNRTNPKAVPATPAGLSPLTINALTGEQIQIPNPDIRVDNNVNIIGSNSCLDLGTNEPQASDLTTANSTITLYIGRNLNDNNSSRPTNAGNIIAGALDANNAAYPVNAGLAPRGLYIGLSFAKPMGERSQCSGTNGGVIYVEGLSPRSNYEIPTIVFFGTNNGTITGNISALTNDCNIANQNPGMSLPNVIIYKNNVNPALNTHTPSISVPGGLGGALRVHGNMSVLIGTFNLNSAVLLFGDYSGQNRVPPAPQLTLTQLLEEDDRLDIFGIFDMGQGAFLRMNTGATERGTILRVRKGGFFNSIGVNVPFGNNTVTREGTPGQYYRFVVYNGGGIASFRTAHTFLSGVNDASVGVFADENALPNISITQSPSYDLPAFESNLAAETGPGSGHGWIASRGGMKVLWGAIVNPFNTSSPDDEFGPLENNFSRCSFGSGFVNATSITINTGQELEIYGASFGKNSGTESKNIVANSRVYFAPADPNLANVNIITLRVSSGDIGGEFGEQFDGGKNDEDLAPLNDLIIWKTFVSIFWVGDYNGATLPTLAQPATTFYPAVPAQAASPTFRSGSGEGVNSPIEFIAGTGTINENHSGINTDWTNPKNWSLSNRSYYNPYQIFPGQTVIPVGFPKKPGSTIMLPFGTPGNTIPADTLEKFEIEITRTATSNPTMNVSGLTVAGSVTVNAGIIRDFGTDQIRTTNSFSENDTWGRLLKRLDIIPQVANAQQNPAASPHKVFTIPVANNFTIGGDLIMQVNGRVLADGNLQVRGNVLAYSNLPADNQQPPANAVFTQNTNTIGSTFINPNPGVPVTGNINLLNQLDFNTTGTLTLNGKGDQSIKVARNPLHNVIVSKTGGTVKVQGLNVFERTKMNLTGNFELRGGQFEMLSETPLLVNGNAILNASVAPSKFNFGSSPVTVRGNWTNTGAQIAAGTGRMNFHPNTTTPRTITTNGEKFGAVHFGFFEKLNGNGGFHLDALPEKYPISTPSNPTLVSPAALTGSTTYVVQDSFEALELTTIYNNRTLSTVAGANIALKMAGVKVLNGATLDLQPGAELLIDPNSAYPLYSMNTIDGIENVNVQAGKTRTLLIQEGGTLNAVGSAAKSVKISRNGTTGNYRFIMEGTMQARFFLFEFMDSRGVDLSGLTPANATEGAGQTTPVIAGSGIPVGSGILGTTNANGKGVGTNITPTLGSFSDGIFTNGSTIGNATPGLGAAYLRLPDNYNTGAAFIERTNFPLSLPANCWNVSRLAPVPTTAATADITDFRETAGIFAGEANDEETNSTTPGPNGHIRWFENVKRWDGKVDGGAVTTNNNWSDRFNWEGDAVPLATDEVRLDFTAVNLDPQYNTGVRTYQVDANVAGTTKCKSLTIISNIQPITLKVVTSLEVGESSGGDLSASVGSIIDADSKNISVAGSWSNDGQFISGTGTVTLGLAYTGSRVVKAGSNVFLNNPFYNVTFGSGTSELNSTLFTKNNITINNTATLYVSAADNRIEIEGNWLNNGTFRPRFGEVVFTGDDVTGKNQTITKTGVPNYETFWNLTIAKGNDISSPTPAASVFNVTLNNRVLVGDSENDRGGTLKFRNGKFITTKVGDKQLIMTEKTSWIRTTTPTPPSGFVSGPVGRIFTSNLSQESLSFPVGDNTNYLAGPSSADGKILLNLVLNSASRTAFTVEQINGDVENVFDPTKTRALPSNVNLVSKARWWDVKNIAFPATALTAADIAQGEVTLPFVAGDESAVANGVTYPSLTSALIEQTSIISDFDFAADDALNQRGLPGTAGGSVATAEQIRRGFAPQEGERWRDLGGIADLNSLTGSTGITSNANFKTLGNGQFTFGFFFLPLPVELLDLKAEVQGEKVRVSWITVSEKNNDYFIVEKSIDAKNFEEVGRVPAKTSTSTLNNYEIFDANPYQAINYYRLKQFDTNGKFTYSKIISIKMGKTTANNLSIYPNPTTNNEFVVDLKGNDLAGAQVTVTDMLGKTVYSTKIDQNGTNQLIRPNTTLAAGMYVVTVQTNDKVYQQRLSVK